MDALEDFHRMLYVFACVSEKCIATQCVRVFRALVQDKNSMVNFLSDHDYNQICKKTDEELETTKWSKYLFDDCEEDDCDVEETKEDSIFLEEFLIETDEE